MIAKETSKIAVLVLGRGGLPLVERLRAILGPIETFGFAPRVETTDVTFTDIGLQLEELFLQGRPILGICAAGILIRKLAPLLDDKQGEPPVLALAEDGSAVVPLLGGHRGANALAVKIAEALGAQAAITTAGDLRFGFALDLPPPGWKIADLAPAKRMMAATLSGEGIRLECDLALTDCDWLKPLPIDPHGRLAVKISHRALPADPDSLVFHPPVLTLGIGCERGADAAEVIALARETLAQAGLAPQAVAGIFSIALKAAEPAIHALAEALAVPARFFSAAALEAETPRLATPSETVFRETGCHGVAEGAALAAAGPDGRLLVAKRKSARATCAIGLAARAIDATSLGHPRGRLWIVGIGPGAASQRTPAADQAIRAAQDLVGYKLYLDLLGPLTAGKTRHEFALGEEERRVRHALELAAQGREVALISSGDAGIYAMATLVYESIERQGDGDWARIEIRGLPGISAMQAASALAGAPLGHDFCTISLSDLLTPWAVIEQRLRAAAAGDFVVAFYNPVSQRRRDQLARAKEILLGARPPQTPVMLARNLGRDGEKLTVTSLGELSVDQVDMLTVVLVGNRESRLIERPDGGQWVYTPRGYAAKGAPTADTPDPVEPAA